MSSNSTITPLASTTAFPTLFQLYASAGFSTPLVLGLLPMWVIATLGVFFNTALVYVTIKKRLNNWCNTLIALDCAYCALSESSVSITFFVVLSGQNWIPLSTCFWLLSLPTLGYILSYGGMLAIALERLCATLFLLRDGTPQKGAFLVILIGSNLLMATYYGCSNFVNYLQNFQSNVTCNTGDLFLPGSYLFFTNISLGIIAATALCYIAIGLILRQSRKKNLFADASAISFTRKIYRSLLAILIIIVCSHFASAIWRLTKPPGGIIPALSSFYQEKLFYCLTYFANTANAPVLYLMRIPFLIYFCIFDSEYNKAFKSLRPNPFGFLDRISCKSLIPSDWSSKSPTMAFVRRTKVPTNKIGVSTNLQTIKT